MKVTIIILSLLTISCVSTHKLPTDFEPIRQVMALQEIAWNEGDIEGFMEGYWKSDELRFTSTGRTNMGWRNTLNSYKKSYPDKDAMGELKFEILDIYPISHDSAALNGSFYLTRKSEDLSGFFNLVFKKINGDWKIISDMTCSN